MRHVGCGGEVTENWTTTYEYESDDGTKSTYPQYICKRCMLEILGDRQIELEGENGKTIER